VPELIASISPLRDFSVAAQLWRSMEARVDCPFFLSWDWITAAIGDLRENLYLAEIRNVEGDLYGLGIFCALTEQRNSFVNARQLRLHEFGTSSDQSIVIEYNTLLTKPTFEAPVWQALLKALHEPTAPEWDEVIIVNAALSTEEIVRKFHPKIHRRAKSKSGWVNLKSMRDRGAKNIDDYLANISRNTRSQIKRALRLYSERGSVQLTRATTKEDALFYMKNLAALHELKWRARGADGLITQRHFFDFHTRLIERCFDKGRIELLRASAGDEPFGWLYNFIDGNRILFNVGGFKPEIDNKYKPGLVTQALAIESHLKTGADAYDFLAGTDRYKFSLGEDGPDMTSFAIQKQTPTLIVESAARSIKTGIRNLLDGTGKNDGAV